MADKKINAFDPTTGEVQEQEDTLKVESHEEPVRILRVHCKPAFNYQSIEFDLDIRSDNFEEDLKAVELTYSQMLAMLVRAAAIAPQTEAKKPVAPVEEPATEAQKQILRNFHIDFKPDITKKQAHALIKKSMDQEVF